MEVSPVFLELSRIVWQAKKGSVLGLESTAPGLLVLTQGYDIGRSSKVP
jgi:hypothetical protein